MIQFHKIKFSQLLASVKEDLHKYADEGLIDPSRLIKVVHRCNEVLGINLYDRQQCVVEVENGKAELPLDFYKMEMIFAVGDVGYAHTGPINPHVKKDYVVHPACMCDGGTTVCVYPVHQPDYVIKYTTIIPLILNGSENYLTNYSPMVNWKGGKYSINIQEDIINVGFDTGTLFLSYRSDLIDKETGEILVPFHSRLNDYYEYSVKTKILEDLLMNSEADVQGALAYAKRERNLAYYDAVDYTLSKSYGELKLYNQKLEREFYQKNYSMFY
jgi:hypothetical protein